MRLIIFLAITLFVGGCSSLRSSYPNILRDGEWAFAIREDGVVMCRTAQRAACGIRLSNCNSEVKYECVPSVIIINANDYTTQ